MPPMLLASGEAYVETGCPPTILIFALWISFWLSWLRFKAFSFNIEELEGAAVLKLLIEALGDFKIF